MTNKLRPFLDMCVLDTKKLTPRTRARTIRAGIELVKTTVMPNNKARPKAKLPGRYLFGFSIESNGKGKRSIKSAVVENVEPVGVKLVALAKSNGKKMPKNDARVITATTAALA